MDVPRQVFEPQIQSSGPAFFDPPTDRGLVVMTSCSPPRIGNAPPSGHKIRCPWQVHSMECRDADHARAAA
jgi:hypothetical protein